MDKEELKKKVCTNLRSVTQSCKGGVPLHRLQFDYKVLLGNDIPYKSLGYDSLESFIWNIPDVVRIKMTNGQRVVVGVVDQSTAHIASMISKQKKSKSEIGLKKPVSGIKNSGNRNQIHTPPSSQATFKVQVHPNPKLEDLKRAVLINLRGIIMSSKDGVLLKNLQSDYHAFIGTLIPFDVLGFDSLENFIQSIPDVINLKMNNAGQLVAVAVPDASTAHISSLINRQKQAKKNGKMALPRRANKNKSPKPKSFQVQQKSKVSSVESLSMTCQSSSSSKDVSRSFTPQGTAKKTTLTAQLSKEIPNKLDTTKNGNSVRLSGKSLGSFPCIKDNITKAHFSTLLGLHNLLFGVSYMDTLKESILKFGGYLFLEDSEEWKKREFLFSVLPADGLNEYLNLLCVDHCDTEEKHALLRKLLSFISSLRTEMIDPKRKIVKNSTDSDLYKKCHEKDKQILEIMQENKNLKAELLKINDLQKNSEKKNLQNSTNSELQPVESKEAKDIIIGQSVEINNLKSEVKKLKTELTAAAAKIKEKGKEKGKFECELNTLRRDRKVDSKAFEQQKIEFVNYIKSTSSKMEKQSISHAAEIKSIQKKLSNYGNIFNKVKEQTAILRNEIVRSPSDSTAITLPLISQLLSILNEVHLQTKPQQSLSSS